MSISKLILEILIKSVTIYAAIYGVQLVKYLIVGELNPTIGEVGLSIVLGWLLSIFILRKLNIK